MQLFSRVCTVYIVDGIFVLVISVGTILFLGKRCVKIWIIFSVFPLL